MGYRVFLSHSSADYNLARYIAENSQRVEVEIYMCEHDVQPGRQLSDKVKSEIDRADCLLVLLSASSQQSTYVHQEVGYAEGCKKPIVPIVCPVFDTAKLSMLQGREYIYYDFLNPQSAIRSMQVFFVQAKKDKSIASGVGWALILLLAGAIFEGNGK